jgi:hypothetical protein
MGRCSIKSNKLGGGGWSFKVCRLSQWCLFQVVPYGKYATCSNKYLLKND